MKLKSFILPLKIIAVIFLLLHVFIFLGLFLTGILQFKRIIGTSDLIIGSGFIFIGGLLAIMSAKYIVDVLQDTWPKKIDEWWKKNKIIALIALGIFIALFVFRFQLQSMLLFLGYNFGRLAIEIIQRTYGSLIGYRFSSPILLAFSWAFQWYFVIFIVDLGVRGYRRFFAKFFRKKIV